MWARNAGAAMKAFHCCQHCGSLALPKDVKLTDRQRQILEMVLRRPAVTTEQICWALEIAPKTVHVHISGLNANIAHHGFAVRSSNTVDRYTYPPLYRLVAEPKLLEAAE